MKNESDFQFDPAPVSERSLDLVHRITAAGYSNTRARRAVLQALACAHEPISPAELLAAGRHYHPALGLVTVYRTLDILAGLGLVRRLHLVEGCHSYALSTPSQEDADCCGDGEPYAHGHHIICQECRRTMEFAGCDIEAIVAAVEAQTGYSVRSHWLEMFGLCPSCQEKRS